MSEQPEVERKPPLTDAEREALVNELAKQRARRMAQAISDLDQSLNQDASQEAQAQPIRRANGGAGNTEAPTNEVKPKPEHADAQTLLAAFMVELAEGEEFVVVNAQEKRESFWKRNGRLENSEGKQSRGSIVKILTKGGKLEKKAAVRAGAPVVDDATSTIFDDEKEKRTERILHWLGEYSHRPEPEIKAMVAELQGMLSTNPDDAAIDDITRRMTEFYFPAQDNGKDVATPDAGIDEKQAQKIRKDQVRAVVDQLGDLGTVEAADLATEGLKLQFLFDLTDAQVAEFEEKARALLSAPATADQPLGTVDPVIRNLDGQGKEQKELFELHEGDTWIKRQDGKIAQTIILLEPYGNGKPNGFRARIFSPEEGTDKNTNKNTRLEHKSIDDLQALFQQEGYVREMENFPANRIKTRPAVPDVNINLDEPNAPDVAFDEAFVFQPLEKGGQAEYKGTKGDILLQRGAGDLYQICSDAKVSGFVLTEEEIKSIAKEEQWQRVGEVVPAKAEEPIKPEKIEGLEIGELYAEVESMRLDYVTTDYKQNSAWQKIRRFFGKNLSEGAIDSDTESAKSRYERALMSLQEAQLAQIKASNLTPEAVRERMAGMLRYFKYDEQIKLADTRNQVKIENLKFRATNPKDESSVVKVGRELVNGIQQGVTLAEQIGRFYNKRSKWEKLALAGVALGTGFMGGAAVAGGLVMVRRALATAGLAVTIDTAVLTRQENKRLKQMEEEQLGDLKTLEDTREGAQYDFELFDNLLKRDIRLTDEKFKAIKHQDIVRRSVVWGASVVGMLGISYSASHIREWWSGGQSVTDHGQGSGRGIKPPAVGASAPVAERASATLAPGATTPIASPRVAEFAPGKPVTPEITSIQKIHEVTSADGKRGLWGILDKRIPEGFEGDKNRAIQALQNAMRAKLDAMSPADRASLGFPKGLPDGRVNLDFIKPGDKIDFGALLTPQEIQDALEGKSVGAPSTASVLEKAVQVASEVGETVQTPDFLEQLEQEKGVGFERAIDKISDSRFTEGINPGITDPYEDAKGLKAKSLVGVPDPYEDVPARPTPSYDDARNAYTAKEFAASQVVETKVVALSAFEQAPAEVKTEMMLRMTGYIQKSIFLTPVLMADTPMNAPFDYTINKGAMAYVQMGRITEKFAELHSGQFNRFNRMAFPLHPSQVDQVVRLVSLAQDPRFFGTAGLPKPVENVEQYTRRIAQLALSAGKERELFLLLQSRRNSLI